MCKRWRPHFVLWVWGGGLPLPTRSHHAAWGVMHWARSILSRFRALSAMVLCSHKALSSNMSILKSIRSCWLFFNWCCVKFSWNDRNKCLFTSDRHQRMIPQAWTCEHSGLNLQGMVWSCLQEHEWPKTARESQPIMVDSHMETASQCLLFS